MYTECIFPEGNLLSNFVLHCCPNSSIDEGKDKRDSVQSEDSGIERNLKKSDLDDREQPPVRNPVSAFNRRNAFKNMKPADKLTLMREKIETFPGSSPVLKESRRPHSTGSGNGG